MKGVRFGEYHSFYEWGLILSSKEIEAPEPKINQIEIEGGDGVLDLTDFFGDVKYKNRSLSFEFSKMNIVLDGFLALYSVVQNAIHGKVLDIILDDDPAYYYRGRVTINEWKSDKNVGTIVIEVDAEPYKYDIDETVISIPVSGSTEVNLINSRKRVVPQITTDATFTFVWGNYSKAVSAGTFVIPEMELKEGNNSITVIGTGTAVFSYRKGGL